MVFEKLVHLVSGIRPSLTIERSKIELLVKNCNNLFVALIKMSYCLYTSRKKADSFIQSTQWSQLIENLEGKGYYNTRK